MIRIGSIEGKIATNFLFFLFSFTTVSFTSQLEICEDLNASLKNERQKKVTRMD